MFETHFLLGEGVIFFRLARGSTVTRTVLLILHLRLSKNGKEIFWLLCQQNMYQTINCLCIMYFWLFVYCDIYRIGKAVSSPEEKNQNSDY